MQYGLTIDVAARAARIVDRFGLIGSIGWLAFIAWSRLRAVLRQRRVTGETLANAMSADLLLGLSWGLLYVVICQVHSEAFSFGAAPAPNAENAVPAFIYFSRTTAASMLFATLAFLALATWAGAQVSPTPAAPAEEKPTPRLSDRERLAKEFSDPLTALPQIFVQDAYTPANYGTDAPANRAIVRAIFPRIPRFTLLPFVQLVRPSISLVTVPTGKTSATRTELGDMQLFDAAVLPWRLLDGLTIGVGPTFVFPTATYKTAGQGSWQVGPLLGAIYKGLPWLLTGALIQNPISFAYTSSDRQPVSTLLFQPIVLVALPGGWYVKSADSTWVLNCRRGTATLLPLSFGIGRVLVREGLPPVNFYVSAEWLAYRQFAPVAPQTTVRFGLTVAFPELRAW